MAATLGLALSFPGYQASSASAAEPLPEPAGYRLPRWRGFNLLEKMSLDWQNEPFRENDFRMIAELGFNFVRLPMDYRVWIIDGDWYRFDQEVLREIDQAIGWGVKYNLHVCLNFHRAPGYSVAEPAEQTNLWHDTEAQEVFAIHWRMFARRYRTIHNRHLSFNLINEPADIDATTYARVVARAVAAIREEDEDRLIIVDGLDHGRNPVPELAMRGVAQATRGYEPFELTHYKAPWVENADQMPPPRWPRHMVGGYLYGPGRPELHDPMIVEGPFTENTRLRLRVNTVSDMAILAVKADRNIILQQVFKPGPGDGDWQEAVFNREWETYQNIYDRNYHAEIPAGTEIITIEVTTGDWLSLSEIGLRQEHRPEKSMTLVDDWGQPPSHLAFQPGNRDNPFAVQNPRDRAWLRLETILPWQRLQADNQVGVMVGEWGAFNRTPHAVVMAWAEDCLKNWRQAGWGWALWNFRGPFGILDSEREDVEYEEFQGHLLDREFLELLKRY